jgi:expansin (peptidoglycan-binding protein)
MRKGIMFFFVLLCTHVSMAQTNLFPVSGSVGIGTLTPTGKVMISLPTASSGVATMNNYLQLGGGENSVGSRRLIGFGYSVPANMYQPAHIGYIETAGSNLTKGALIFGTRDVETDAEPTERMRIASNGNIGIGTTAPTFKLDINASSAALNVGNSRNSVLSLATFGKSPVTTGYATADNYLQIGAGENAVNGTRLIGFGYSVTANTYQPAYMGYIETTNSGETKGDLIFGTRNAVTDITPTERMRITGAGNIGIGTTTPAEKLSVNGNIRAKKIIISHSDWPDFVFTKKYKLRSLSSVEAFIHKYGYLPEMPTAVQVEKNGISVGDTQALLLKKIEELTLYMIEQQKQITTLEKKIKRIQKNVK